MSVRLHDLCHIHACIALKQGKTVLAIGRTLGHTDPETTLKYTHPADAMSREPEQPSAVMHIRQARKDADSGAGSSLCVWPGRACHASRGAAPRCSRLPRRSVCWQAPQGLDAVDGTGREGDGDSGQERLQRGLSAGMSWRQAPLACRWRGRMSPDVAAGPASLVGTRERGVENIRCRHEDT